MDPNQLPVADCAPYHDALAQCVDHWNLVPEKTSLLRDGVNHAFATETTGGDRVIVRITDGGLRQPGELDGELPGLNHLVQHGCTVSTPIPSRAGALLESIALEAGTYYVCCFERFAGREIDPRTDAAWNDELMLPGAGDRSDPPRLGRADRVGSPPVIPIPGVAVPVACRRTRARRVRRASSRLALRKGSRANAERP